MEMRHLRYFVALAQCLNFTRAAAMVHVAQSTLSHQIKQLEIELGRPLFDRERRKIRLTVSGELFLPQAVRALSEIDGGIKLLNSPLGAVSGLLRVGTTYTFNMNVVPRCIALFNAEHPGVSLSIEEDTSARIAQRIAAGSLDLAIAYEPDDAGELSFSPLCREELLLIVGPRHPLVGRKRIRLAELHGRELIMPPASYATRGVLDRAFATARAQPVVKIEATSIAAMLAVVRQTRLATLVSRLALQPGNDLKAIPLESPTPARTPGLIWASNKPRTPAEASLAAIIRRVTNECMLG